MDWKLPPPGEVTAGVDRLIELASGKVESNLGALQQKLRQIMWDKVGIIRSKQSLEDARKEIHTLRERLNNTSSFSHQQLYQVIKLSNMLTVSEMVCRAALMRTESRGSHYRADYPEEDDNQWLRTIDISYRHNEMRLNASPVNGN